MPGPRIEEVSRVRLARDALRFGFLGALLLYAFVPPALAAGEDLLGLRSVRPGPWAGALAGLACVLGGIFFSAGPVWRSTLRPPRWLVDAQFYSTAVGAITVFASIMTTTWGMTQGTARPPPSRALSGLGGALLCAGMALFAVNVVLAIRNHRAVRRPPSAGT